jgi:hypothetical protein
MTKNEPSRPTVRNNVGINRDTSVWQSVKDASWTTVAALGELLSFMHQRRMENQAERLSSLLVS